MDLTAINWFIVVAGFAYAGAAVFGILKSQTYALGAIYMAYCCANFLLAWVEYSTRG